MKGRLVTRTGVDIVHIRHFEAVLEENNAKYFSSVYTDYEMQCAAGHRCPAAFYATRFAAKEAVFKALSIEWEDSMEWSQIEIRSHACGSLEARFFGRIQEIARENGVRDISLSVSWDADYAVAFVLITALSLF